jgi:hypothetical protein
VSAPQNEPQIDINEILAEMDELGRAKFDAAVERVKTRKLAEHIGELRTRISELESQRAVPDPLKNGRAVRDSADPAEHTREAGKIGG